MKRILSTLTLLSLVVLPAVAAAASEPGEVSNIETILTRIRTAIWGAFVILAVIAFLYAAILYVTAGGDPEKVGKAKQATIFGIVGIVIALLGYSILAIVQTMMGV